MVDIEIHGLKSGGPSRKRWEHKGVREVSPGLKKNLCHGERILSHIEAKLFILYGRFDTQTPLSLLMMSMVLVSLMEIKGFWQCIAANKQQWCALLLQLVAAWLQLVRFSYANKFSGCQLWQPCCS